MSTLSKNENRVLVPAWSKSNEAAYSSEMKSLKTKEKPSSNLSCLDTLYHEFTQNANIGIAIELLSVSYTEDDILKAKKSASYIVQSGKKIPKALFDFCNKLLNDKRILSDESNDIYDQIKTKRRWLKNNPKDCICWIDLARLYMSIGQIEPAEKAIIIGLSLSNNNRWVTRVSSRFFYNLTEYERAHQILLKHPNIKNDPWLLASELAVSTSYGRNTKLWSRAKRLIESDYSKYHMSELHSAIGTLELNSGAIKKSKGYFRDSLEFPNGNVFAQAKWAEKKGNIKGLVPHARLNSYTRAYEAKCRESYACQDMENALLYAKKWFEEEPYSSIPTLHASFISSLLENYSFAYEISKHGLKIEPHNETIKLNVIFSKFSLEQYENKVSIHESFNEAFDKIEAILTHTLNDETKAHAFANLGLIHYRAGRVDEGRNYYKMAADLFMKQDHPSVALAEIMNLRESLIANTSWKEESFEYVEKMTKSNSGSSWSEPFVSYYLTKLHKIRHNSSRWRELLAEPISINLEKQRISEVKFDFNQKRPTIWLPNKR